MGVSGQTTSSPDGSLPGITLSSGRQVLSEGQLESQPLGTASSQGGGPSSTVSAPSTFNCAILIHPVLAFLKAFHLKGDVDTIRRSVCENFSNELVESAKKALWDFCGSVLEAASFPLEIRWDSEKRSQLMANVEDLLKAFEVLDSTDSIPPIFCEASDLIWLPPLCRDPVGKQVQSNTCALHTLTAAVSNAEEKIIHLTEVTKSLLDSSNISHHRQSLQPSSFYATVVSAPPSANSAPLVRSQRPKQLSRDDVRESNVILFGLPEGKSIVESKAAADEVLEFLAGRPVVIKEIFRLGKFSQSDRPRPPLIKLCSIWDRKLLLSRKKNLPRL